MDAVCIWVCKVVGVAVIGSVSMLIAAWCAFHAVERIVTMCKGTWGAVGFWYHGAEFLRWSKQQGGRAKMLAKMQDKVRGGGDK